MFIVQTQMKQNLHELYYLQYFKMIESSEPKSHQNPLSNQNKPEEVLQQNLNLEPSANAPNIPHEEEPTQNVSSDKPHLLGKLPLKEEQNEQQNKNPAQVQPMDQAAFENFNDAQQHSQEVKTQNDMHAYQHDEHNENKNPTNEIKREEQVQLTEEKKELVNQKKQEPQQKAMVAQQSHESEKKEEVPPHKEKQNQNQQNIASQPIQNSEQEQPQVNNQLSSKVEQPHGELNQNSSPPPPKLEQNLPKNLSEGPQQPSASILNSSIIKQAQTERVGSIYQHFCNYNIDLQKTINSYKIVIKNIISEIEKKKNFKKHLENTLIQYFQQYSKIHCNFHEKVFKLPKEDSTSSINKFANIKEQLRHGFEELHYIKKHVGVDAHKLDTYINNYTIKALKQLFENYREEISAEQRREIAPHQNFHNEEKQFKKIVNNLDKICKKGMEGAKYKQDLFIQLVSFINQEVIFRNTLINYGKTVLVLRKIYITAQNNLFTGLQKIMNQFKNQQKTVYTATKEFVLIQQYIDFIEESTTFQQLCTIIDVDYIKGVLDLQNRKERTKFTNEHFEQYLEMPFFEKTVGNSKLLLKGSIAKSFPLAKKGQTLVHTISQYLVHFDQQKNEVLQKLSVRNLNVKIIGQGAIEFDQIMSGLIFKENRTVRMQLQDQDRAEELINYLNQMQVIKEGPAQ